MCIAKKIRHISTSNKIEPDLIKPEDNGSPVFSVSNQVQVVPEEGPCPEPSVLDETEESICKQIWRDWKEYFIGFWYCIHTNEFLKMLVSEPRPYFIEICNPDLSSGICTHENRFELAREQHF